MIEITLTWSQCEQAATAGIHRRLIALRDARPARYGFKEDDTWGSDIESCGAELAVAFFLGIYWTPWERRPSNVTADVGRDIQVRRRSRRGWNLLLHPGDPDNHRFVLVYGELPTFVLAGWTTGYEGKVDRYWGDPYKTTRPAFWVPQDELRDPEELKAEPVLL